MLTFALIGAGRIGNVHAANVAGHPGARLGVVVDPVPGAADRLAEPFGARSSTDIADAFADGIDAVIVGSPTPFHVEHILAAVAAGKAVLVEKPVDLSLARVDECIASVGAAGNRVMVGFNRRFDPGVNELIERARNGEVGPVRQLTIISRDPAGPPLSYIAQSGGIFRDMAIHDLDLARAVLGDFVEVEAFGQRSDPALEEFGDFDGAVTTLRTADGAIATIVNSRFCATGYDQRLEAFGPLGSLETANHRETSVVFNSQAGSTSRQFQNFFLTRYAAAYRAELDHFITSITAGTTPLPGLADGRAALLLADAATASATQGARVAIDVATVGAGARS
ncbi:myo-inositol 2-dehydrogenase/D-chiro-inositol 1-dehydrogenase [Mycetocola sp. CAN_C7]|uniref:Gfo/Idh/MocA family protein n=1 Tax=Mycetocola sp. CAN_C7 TaxID=2787724 RepID=UPI0018CA3156